MAARVSHAALAVNDPEGRCASGPSVQSAKTCSTTAWSRCWASAWSSSNGRVGEHGVVAPDREQLVLPWRPWVLVADPADDQPGGDGLALLRGERGVAGLGDLGVGDPARSWSSQIARGYLMGVQASSGIGRSRRLTCRVHPAR